MSEKESTFAGHNFYADYKYKVTQGQKANGETQLKELKVSGNEWEPLLEIGYTIMEDWWKIGKRKHIKVVSPYETGHEPNV